MERIMVHLLGNPYVEADGARINFPYKKVEGVFYYLCVRKNVTREEIIQVLWGDDNETAGRKNLREAVYRIKKMFGQDFLLTAGHNAICINPAFPVEVDWEHLTEETILDAGEEGPFAHFHIKNSYEYEQWVQDLQEQYNQLYLKCARQGLYQADAKRDIRKIQQYAGALIRHDPYNETVYYEAMDIYALNGNYSLAIKLYHNLEKLLRTELDVPPSPEITALYQRICHMKQDFIAPETDYSAGFFGREEELYRIGECIAGFSEGRPVHSLAIAGEAGVGKSVLLEKAKRMACGYPLAALSATCYRNETDFFLRPWCDIFQELKRGIQGASLYVESAAGEIAYLEHILNGSVLLEEEKTHGYLTYQAVCQAFLELLRKLSAKYRLVLFIDDLQWMDSMSFRLLNRLLLSLEPGRFLLLCTFRLSYEAEMLEALDTPMQKDLLDIIRLECFSEEETGRIVLSLLPDLPPEKCRELYHKTEGNAFFLMEMLSLIREKGSAEEMPPKISGLIKSRLSGLSDLENEILDCLSIFPETVSAEELLLLLPVDQGELLRHLEKLVHRRLVREIVTGWEVSYNSGHYFLSEYLYRRQSVGKKKRYHQILAEHYEQTLAKENPLRYTPLLIYHFGHSHNRYKTYQYRLAYLKEFHEIVYENFPLLRSDIPWDQDLPTFTRGNSEMADLAKEILSWEDGSAGALRLKMEMDYILGRHGISAGKYEEALSHLRRSMELAELFADGRMLVDCCKQMVFYGIQTEDTAVIREYLDKGSALISKGQEPNQYAVLLRLEGVYHLLCRSYERAEKLLKESIEILEGQPGSKKRHSMNIAACYGYIGDIRLEQGRLEEAYNCYRNAIDTNMEKVTTNGLGQFYSHAGRVLDLMGRYSEAHALLEKALECFYRYNYYWGLGRAEITMAQLELHCGRPAEAQSHFEQACRVEERIANPTTLRLIREVKKMLDEQPAPSPCPILRQ